MTAPYSADAAAKNPRMLTKKAGPDIGVRTIRSSHLEQRAAEFVGTCCGDPATNHSSLNDPCVSREVGGESAVLARRGALD